MAIVGEYQDFRCFIITDESEHQELDVEMDKIEELFNSEGVYLFLRYDIRRIFIWKGPRSPVRKRFISSRIASKLQEDSSQVGMHMKIVSVDAGDEVIEFLNAFNVKPYEVSADEVPEDMYYIRNEERRKLEEEQLAQQLENNGDKEKEEYWSPVLEEQSKQDQMEQSKKKAVSMTKEIASSLETPTPKKKTLPIKPKAPQTSFSSSRFTPTGINNREMSEGEEKAVLDLILSQDLPDGMARVNIITGTTLYGPKRVISSLFGKEVEEVEWSRVKSIPDGKINIDTNLLRVYCKDNEIEGLEILGKTDKEPEIEPKKKKLNEIPKGE